MADIIVCRFKEDPTDEDLTIVGVTIPGETHLRCATLIRNNGLTVDLSCYFLPEQTVPLFGAARRHYMEIWFASWRGRFETAESKARENHESAIARLNEFNELAAKEYLS